MELRDCCYCFWIVYFTDISSNFENVKYSCRCIRQQKSREYVWNLAFVCIVFDFPLVFYVPLTKLSIYTHVHIFRYLNLHVYLYMNIKNAKKKTQPFLMVGLTKHQNLNMWTGEKIFAFTSSTIFNAAVRMKSFEVKVI